MQNFKNLGPGRGKKSAVQNFWGIKILKTLEDSLLYSSLYFLGVAKLHVFRIKILGILGDSFNMHEPVGTRLHLHS